MIASANNSFMTCVIGGNMGKPTSRDCLASCKETCSKISA